jgi:polar amino acid transport system substrate-binding protein
MTTLRLPRPIPGRLSSFGRSVAVTLALLVVSGTAVADDSRGLNLPLTVAVYDAPPYGLVEPDGSIDGVSVDLWRRAAEVMGREYRFVSVPQMESLLQGLERNEFDAAIGAITITPERVARVDFSYPAHRSGVAVAVRKDSGAMAAIGKYGAIVAELSPLVAFTLALLVAIGVAMWLVERPPQSAAHESAVASLRDGVYWAVVIMRTVGYGDKTPKTTRGRIIAIVWMLTSVALISILSTSIVSKMPADQVVGGYLLSDADLAGKRLAAVAHSSGAEYLDERHLGYSPFDDLAGALIALAAGRADAVVNSVGTL